MSDIASMTPNSDAIHDVRTSEKEIRRWTAAADAWRRQGWQSEDEGSDIPTAADVVRSIKARKAAARAQIAQTTTPDCQPDELHALPGDLLKELDVEIDEHFQPTAYLPQMATASTSAFRPAPPLMNPFHAAGASAT